MIKDIFVLSLKNLRHRGIRSWLTLLGIFIGVAAVVSLISLGNALQVAVSSQFGVSVTEVITIEAAGINFGPPGSGSVNPLTSKELETVQKLSSVRTATGRNFESAKMEYSDKMVVGYVVSLPYENERKFTLDLIDAKIIEGRMVRESDAGKIIIGYNFYSNKVGLGKEISLGRSITINDKNFEVVGIFDKKGSFIYDNVVYMNERELVNLLGLDDKYSMIYANPTNKNEMEKTKLDIEKALRRVRDVKEGEEDFSVSTPDASMKSVNEVLSGVQAFIVIIALVSIFIGAIGIVNTMTTSVLERKSEIGIMKSIGARNEHIFLQFFIEAGLLGLIGGILGTVFGLFVGFIGTSGINNFFGASLKPQIDLLLILFSLTGSFLIGAASGIIPAMKASKQNPVEALRD